MKIHSIYDNGGATYDRFTVFYKGRGMLRYDQSDSHPAGVRIRACRGMSEHPCHPQGFGLFCEGVPGRHLGKKITFEELPPDCQKLVLQDLGPQKEVANVEN